MAPSTLKKGSWGDLIGVISAGGSNACLGLISISLEAFFDIHEASSFAKCSSYDSGSENRFGELVISVKKEAS
jgi:hypothetical protein